jgi:hypothetical protein
MVVRRTALVGAIAVSMLAVLLTAGPARAAEDPPPVADPIGEGNVCEGAPDDSPFTDTTRESTGTAAAIRCLVTAGITTGTTATTYGPGANVTRRQMALFIKRLADLLDDLDIEGGVEPLPAYDGVPDYPDVALEDQQVQEAVGQLDQAGIVTGKADGTFDPAGLVTRRQMAAFINRLQEHLVGAPFASDTDHFTDDDGDPGEENLNALASVGIFQGEGDGRVVPGGNITRRQMANVLLRHAQVLYADDLIVAPFLAPVAPAEPQARSQGTTVTVTYVRPAANPGSTTYALERVVVDVGPDGTCTTDDDVAPSSGYTRVEASEAEGEGEREWVFTAEGVERGCYRHRVVAIALGGASTASPPTSRSTWVSPASDSTAPTSVEAFVTEGDGEDGVLDAGDVITIVFSEFVRIQPDASLSIADNDGTSADIVRGDGAAFELNTTTVTVNGTPRAPGRVLTIFVQEDLEPGFPGLVAGMQLPARVFGAEGIADAAGNEWSPSPVSGGDTELDVPEES